MTVFNLLDSWRLNSRSPACSYLHFMMRINSPGARYPFIYLIAQLHRLTYLDQYPLKIFHIGSMGQQLEPDTNVTK